MTCILGIETSCDETSAAVVDDGRIVRSNIVASQIDLHRKYGGVVPEIASRAHVECLDAVIQEAMTQADCKPEQVGAVAVTYRPGLVGSLLVGVTAAKTLSWVWGKPLVAVDHVLAHAYSAALGLDRPPWPAVALIASGGHSSLYRVDDFAHIERLGATTDDAAGEAFDKVASILGLGYPGGPEIERLARDGDPKAIDFPRTLLGKTSLDFSFSGIKTAVLYHVHGHGKTSGGLERLSPQNLADIAASFQAAVVEMLNVPAPSPPVPQVSQNISASTRTGVACLRMMRAAAAISSAVSPRMRSAMARPAIWAEVAFPVMISSKALSISWLDRESPATTVRMASVIISRLP